MLYYRAIPIPKQKPVASEIPLSDTPTHEPAAADDDTLAQALARHQIEVDDEQLASLDRYCRALWDFNTRLNLTRHTTYEKFVARDVADCVALEPLLDAGQRVLDVGTGGGVPGVVVAILRPDLEVSLCESVAKKAKAVQGIISAAGLALPVYHAPAQEVLPNHSFDTLIARAVAPLSKLLTWFEPHWESFERLLVIKGPNWIEERAEARAKGLLRNMELRKAASYPLAGTDAESVILSLRPKESGDVADD
jgi:16S rRNA (guanine527-N7)-methyltransferase